MTRGVRERRRDARVLFLSGLMALSAMAVSGRADDGWGMAAEEEAEVTNTKDGSGWGMHEPDDPTRSEPSKMAEPRIPANWTRIEDKLYGTVVAVPPNWTPRVRGEVAFCVEPDDLPRAAAYFVPTFIRPGTQPAALATEFATILKRALPDLQTQIDKQPTAASVECPMTATMSGVRVAGKYRAVVTNKGIGFIMGYLAPADQLTRLEPVFYRILGSYRYTGPKMRLRPFKSAAIELKIPPGWQVQTSEGQGSASQDIDWEVFTPNLPGARVFMYSPKYITPNWVRDMMTGQPDPSGLAIWQGKGFQLANINSDKQAMQLALSQTMPGLQIVRQQSLDEVRDAFRQIFAAATMTLQSTGGQMNLYVYELHGRREVNGVPMRSVVYCGLSAMYTPGGVKGMLGLWQVHVRGYEAPASHFAQLAPMLDRVAGSFTYTLWWIRSVQKANEHQAKVIRNFWAQSNRIDKEIFDHRMETKGAIHEMMYDTLTENEAFVNKQTGTIEKIPLEHLERFRREDGEIVSPEDVLENHLPINEARVLREAWSDDYMAFDRRVQVWP